MHGSLCDRGRIVSRRCSVHMACVSRALYTYYFWAGEAGLDKHWGSSRKGEKRRAITVRSIPPSIKWKTIVCRGCRLLYISSFILILFFRRITLYVLRSSFLDFVRFVSCFVRLLTFSRDETLLFHRAKSHMYTRVSSWMSLRNAYGHLEGHTTRTRAHTRNTQAVTTIWRDIRGTLAHVDHTRIFSGKEKNVYTLFQLTDGT